MMIRIQTLVLYLCLCCTVLTAAEHPAAAPLYRDPIYDGAADPVLIWNRQEASWWMLYSQRRANVEGPDVAFCYGTDVGIASSKDHGKSWVYRGTLDLDIEPGRNTFWAPDVVYHEGRYHLFVVYIQGVRSHWGGQKRIAHYVSENLWDWQHLGFLTLSSNSVIDVTLLQKPDGVWHMWYKDETRGSITMTAKSRNLMDWDVSLEPAIGGQAHEGPKAFRWGQWYWMLTDEWAGMRVYRSPDAENWERQGRILTGPSSRREDRPSGAHGDVLVVGDKAYVFYFTHPERPSHTQAELNEQGNYPYAQRRSSIQVAELKMREGTLVCEREDFDFYLSDLDTRPAALTPPVPAIPSPAGTFRNPLLSSGADPWAIYHEGYYYYIKSQGRRLVLMKTPDITQLDQAPQQVIWRAPEGTPHSRNLWAPEIHYLQGAWYVYYAADDGNNHNHRLYVLENKNANPLEGTFEMKARLRTDAGDNWAIDGTVFEHRGQLYLMWSGWDVPKVDVETQRIYIAQMSNPWTVSSDRVQLSEPQYDWEKNWKYPGVWTPPFRVHVNEGPQMLKHGDLLHVVYSCSGCWTPYYALGMLTTHVDSDLMDPDAWIKSPRPVFGPSPENGVYGAGHNSFFKSPDGTEDWILYHANDDPKAGCGEKRSPRAQKFGWDANDMPIFGVPLPTSARMSKPSGTPVHTPVSQAVEKPMRFADTYRNGIPFSKDPHVIGFGQRYLMYYSVPPYADPNVPVQGWGIGIAASEDLTHWTRVGEVTPQADYERKGICAPCARVIDGRVHLFYQTYGNGRRDAICHAVSDDGLHFTRNATNPIFAPTGDWNAGRAIDAEVQRFQGRYLLYFATRDPDMKIQMTGVASAPLETHFNRDDWTQLGQGPILKPEQPWEGPCVEGASVIERQGKLYMFYAGNYNNAPQQVGVACSDDGVTWRRLSDQPFLPSGKPGEWNASESGHPHIFEDNQGRTWLFYQGNNDNGRTWTLSKVEIQWTEQGPVLKRQS